MRFPTLIPQPSTMPMISAPPQNLNYGQGLARQRADSAYQELWDGLVGLWAPVLGPTGLTLLNFSPHGQALDGTLTNMDPGTDWVGSRYGWSLNFPDNTDFVAVPHHAALIPLQISARVVFRTPAVLVGGAVISKGKTGPTRLDYYLWVFADGRLQIAINDGIWHSHTLAAGTITTDTWCDVAFCFDGVRAKIWIDGRLRLDEAETTVMPQTKGGLYLGGYALNPDYSFRGQLALSQIWNRALTDPEVALHYGDPFAQLRFRRRLRGIFPAEGGPYSVVAEEMFHTGAGTGQIFNTGSTEGQIDGRCG